MSNIIEWFKTSNRWKHLAGGLILGILSDSWYSSILIGASVGGALELKDKLWGGKPDWIDFSLTVIGSIVGKLLQVLLLMIVS